MLVKCETKSNRVKGLSFHPKLSWVLCSLHNGTIQLWDYRIGTLIDKFDDHDGPVRGVSFHRSQPIFCSGGDDYKIKVWNYKFRRCLFTLLGHLDYIRTVQFHHEYPWILSSSDDQTVRIWNWQSRGCIAVLTGHNHYVMCARFHPSEDLVCSASLDQTVRVWDTSGLRDKTVSIGAGGGKGKGGDPFATNDAIVKYVLEGHDRGVNWADFHPTQPLLVSGADDRLIKLWRMSETKAWEVDTLRGHFNNVSCVTFHPNKDLIVSNSEDRTIRVWDVTKRTGVHTFRRENDRFWVIATHPYNNLIGVGHDSGMVVFKLDRERPAYQCHNTNFFYVKDRVIRMGDLNTGNLEGSTLSLLRKPQNAMLAGTRGLHFNNFSSTEINILVQYDYDGGSYDLFSGPQQQLEGQQGQQGSATHVAFIARNRFAALSKDGSIGIYTMQNELSKKVSDLPFNVEALYPGGSNRILVKSEEKLYLYDLTGRKIINELALPSGIRYVIWSPNMNACAILSKQNITLVSKNLEYLCSIHEHIRVKSGAWDEHGVFVYSTLTHVKYLLQNGDSGIILSLDSPIYIARVARQKMYYMDREETAHKMDLNCHEFLFKLALLKKNFHDVQLHIRSGRICGSVVIGYLKKKGYPEVALHFVEDPMTRFNLALDYGHIEEAMKAAQTMNDKNCWSRLGAEALRQGNQQIVEMVYQRTMDFEALSFLYLITGNRTKLKKMLKIASEKRQDAMSVFNNALMLGNVEERVKVLASVGQVPLAALTARAHNLNEFLSALEENLQKDVSTAIPTDAKCLLPPIPCVRPQVGQANWPLLQSTAALFEDHLANAVKEADARPADAFLDAEEENGQPEENENPWADEDAGAIEGAGGGDWGGDMDLDLDLPDSPTLKAKVASGPITNMSPGETPQQRWLRIRRLPCDLVAAGEFTDALDLLSRRIGLVNPTPLQPLFERAYMAAQSFTIGLPQAPGVALPMFYNGSLKDATSSPKILFNVEHLMEALKEGHKLTTQGKFKESLSVFREVLQSITLSAAANQEEDQQLHEFMELCREYITAMRMETTRKDLPSTDVKRSLELASYMTVLKLQPQHLLLTLRVAMTLAYKAQNFVTASIHAKRIVNMGQGNARAADAVTQARKVLLACEQKGTDAHSINFDQGMVDRFVVCAKTFIPLTPVEGSTQCPFCGTHFNKKFIGQTCDNCGLCEVGRHAMGIQFKNI